MALNQVQFKSDLDTAMYNTLYPALRDFLKEPINAITDDSGHPYKATALADADKKAQDLAKLLSDSLADSLSRQITNYIQTADIMGIATTDTVTVPSGVLVTTTGTALEQAGATTAPGIGTGTGTQSNIVHPI